MYSWFDGWTDKELKERFKRIQETAKRMMEESSNEMQIPTTLDLHEGD